MFQYASIATRCALLVFVATFGLSGCNQASGPSYADLVVIYNAEVEALDRLEKKREVLMSKLEALTQPTQSDKAADMLKGLLETAGDLKRKHEDDIPVEPDSALDRALENADQAEAIASQVIDAMTQPSAEEVSANQEELISLRVELAELEKQIAQQEERVERARNNRDAAERQP